MNKKELRKWVAERKAACEPMQRVEWSQAVCACVLQTAAWEQAKVVLLYHALPDEVDTARLLEEGLSAGKQLLLPVVVGDELELRVYEDEQTMKRGSYGILEPTGRRLAEAEYDQIDLVVVPGVAFDRRGYRLGRGKGYYDRLLPKLRNAYKMGVCWPVQWVEEVPCEAFDVRMDVVIK